jgi:hypothetical protein
MSKPARIRAASTAQLNITTTAALIVETPLPERSVVMVRNCSTTSTLYLGFAEADATVESGWPLRPGDIWRGAVAPGLAVWGVASAGTVDVRIMQGAG